MSNGAAHSLYLVIEHDSNKRIEIIISKFTFVCLFVFFFIKMSCLSDSCHENDKSQKKWQISHCDVTCALCYFRHWV